MESEKKLKNRFKTVIKKYHSYCLKKGYASWDCNTLLWYFNRSGHAHKNGNGYFITFKNQDYRPRDIIEYFTLPKNGNQKQQNN